MAWLRKPRRPALLAVVGLGFLGYKTLLKDRELVGQRQVGAGVQGAATARPPLTTPTAEARVSRRPRHYRAGYPRRQGSPGGRLPGRGGAVGLLPPVCGLSVCALSDGTAGLSANSQSDGALSGRPATPASGRRVH